MRGQLNSVRGMLGGTGARMGRLFAAGMGALGTVGAGAGLFKAVQGAMDLGETLSKVGVVFGPAAAEVTGQADRMAESFGLAKQESLDAAAMFGLMAQGAGMSADASAGFSNEMVKLAADAMSFYNVPLDVALEKIRAGLSGESEPLRAFGVFLTEAAVKNEALRLGLIKTGDEMTEGQKIMARSSLITRGMSAASGDLERTQNSAANVQKRLVGSFVNSMTDLGNAVMPVWTGLLDVAAQVFTGIGGWFRANATMFQGWVTGISEGLAVVGVILRNWGTFWEIVGLTATEKLTNIGELVQWFVTTSGAFIEWFGRNWVNIFVDAGNAIWTVFQNLGSNIQGLWNAVLDFFRTGRFEFDGKPLLDGFKATMEALPEIAAPQMTSLRAQIDEATGRMGDAEAARAEARAAAEGIGGPGARPPVEDEVTAKKDKDAGRTMSLESFAQKLQAGAFGAEGTARRQLVEQQQTNIHLEKLVTKGGVGVGAGAIAVAAP